MELLASLIINALAVYITARILPGVMIGGFFTAIIVSLALSIINVVIKPLLILLTLPVTVLTLGLFLLVINAAMVLLVSFIVPDFDVQGFWWALAFSLILTGVGSVLNRLIK